MKRYLFALAVLCCCLPMRAYEFSDEVDTKTRTSHVVELRQSAGVDFKLGKSGSLGLTEEIREVVFDTKNDPMAYFSKSYTTVEAGWKLFSVTDAYNGYKYGMKLSAGYTLRYLNQKLRDKDGNVQAPADYLRHRPFATLSFGTNFGPVKLTLRERYLADIRTDSVNVLEKPKCYMELRHRLTADFAIPGKTYKPFTAIEVANTLNQPSCFDAAGNKLYGGQYISAVRARVGLHWKPNKQNTLTFSYGFHWGQSREVNITKKDKINRLYMDQTYKHVISIAYEFGM